MRCSTIAKKYATTGKLNKKEQIHAHSCEYCSAFIADIDLLCDKLAIHTPTNLKNETRQRCLDIESRMVEDGIIHRLTSHVHTSGIFIVLGVAITLVLLSLIMIQAACNNSDLLCRVVSIIVIIIALQNIISIACAPIIIQQKSTFIHQGG